MQFYLPSAMFVSVSWISFLISIETGERGGLILTTFLVLVTMYLAAVESSPRADTLTALEVWLIACLLFVFLTVIEYGIILKLNKFRKNFENKSTTVHVASSQTTTTASKYFSDQNNGKKYELIMEKIDNTAFWITPLLFVLFNLCYWCYYY